MADNQTWLARPDSSRSRCGVSPEPVDLVEDQDLRQVGGADLREHAVHFVDVLLAARIADVDHVQQQRGFARLGERRLERRPPARGAARG
jgi:hypothetical protein